MVPEESFSLHSGAFSIPVIEPKRIIDMNEYIYGPVTGHIEEIFGRPNKKKPICFFVGTVGTVIFSN
jgi:F0F1-type ATP synthase membrane subunit a